MIRILLLKYIETVLSSQRYFIVFVDSCLENIFGIGSNSKIPQGQNLDKIEKRFQEKFQCSEIC